jgi:hypothetical protein
LYSPVRSFTVTGSISSSRSSQTLATASSRSPAGTLNNMTSNMTSLEVAMRPELN